MDFSSQPTAERDSSMIRQPESFAFVMNVAHLGDSPTLNLAPGHCLRRASPQELGIIKSVLSAFNFGLSPIYNEWEYRQPLPNGPLELMPETEWRYYVLAFRGTNSTFADIEHASSLMPLELEFGFSVLYHVVGDSDSPGFMRSPGALFQSIDSLRFPGSELFVEVTSGDAHEISRLTDLIAALNTNDLLNVKRLLTQLRHLKSIPRQSPLLFLGYFGILEALLTHAPKPADPYDSITRQVKKKIQLLDHRWPNPLDYAPFGKATGETVWSKMYSYRSLLAHGGIPDFTSDLRVLGDHKNALKLLKDTVKAVIREALIEPQLIADLREC